MTTQRLFGRDEELRVLTVTIEAAGDTGGVVLVRGEAGIGKSSMLQTAATFGGAAGLGVLRTTGVESEAQLPFAGLHQLLRPLIGRADGLPAAQQRALLAAFGAEDGPPPEPFMIALAALNLLTDAATERPLLVVVDDVQWLDRPTHDVLAFVARRIGADPVVMVGAIRAGFDGPLLGVAGLTTVDIGGLPEPAARQLVLISGADLPAASQEQILREARGNPLALVELPIAWRGMAQPTAKRVVRHLPLTARLERAFAGRLADLPPESRDALLVAAVDYGDELPEILAATAVLVGAPVTTDVWTAGVDAGLVQVDEVRVAFHHPLVRSGILQIEPLARRQAANAALADVVEEPYRRTWHRAQSIVGPDDVVADELEARHAIPLGRGAVGAAIWSLQRSAQLTTDPAKRGHRLLLAAEHAFGLGQADLVDGLVTAAGEEPLSTLDQARLEWLREIFNDGRPGDATRIKELCEVALVAERAGDRDLALNLLHGASLRAWWASAGRAAQDLIVDTATSLPQPTDNPRYVAVLAVAHPSWQGGAVLAALAKVERRRPADPTALFLYGMAAHAVGDPERVVDLFTLAERRLREQGRLGLLSQVLTMQVLDRMELGEWDQAMAAAEEARRLAVDTGQPIWDTGSLSLNAIMLSLRGDNEVAQEMAGRAAQDAGTRKLNNLLACVQLTRGFGFIREGRYTHAYAELRRMFDPQDAAFHESERYHALAPLAEAARNAGQEGDARQVVKAMAAVAQASPAPTLLVHLDYARAVLASDDEAEALFEAALARNLIRWPWHRARLELAYGSWLRRRRRVAASRVPLQSAYTTLDLIGATAWAEQAAIELRAAGERLVGAQPATHEVLSPQELQVARLAAEGLSNREIGEQLYLSPRSVGSILYRLFPKLNITSRGQLALKLGIRPEDDRPKASHDVRDAVGTTVK